MITVRIKYSPAAKRYFISLKKNDKQLRELYKSTSEKLSSNPEIGEFKTGDLAGIRGYDFRYKGTVYEIAYTIEMDRERGIDYRYLSRNPRKLLS
ncbi:type II toxin-antitoxin system RelE/ParE family toxin [Exiguobacterium alkaliphilum]|uniref:type II toxin-antitoxin system RelE/ParE family toxin n=1 Tax=Exiguobacterium alkaliphilum TaxID=1428684 RepID=UPI00308426AA